MLRLLVADDHKIVRAAVCSLIEHERPDWHIIAQASDGKEAIELAIAHKPDVAILDYRMPMMSGAGVARALRDIHLPTEVLIFSMYESDALIKDILLSGARGYLLKSDSVPILLEAISALSRHMPFFSPQITEAVLQCCFNHPHKDLLTSREKCIAQLVAEGYCNKEIAQILKLSLKTIETHRASMMRKLQIKNTAQVVRYAIRNMLVEP